MAANLCPARRVSCNEVVRRATSRVATVNQLTHSGVLINLFIYLCFLTLSVRRGLITRQLCLFCFCLFFSFNFILSPLHLQRPPLSHPSSPPNTPDIPPSPANLPRPSLLLAGDHGPFPENNPTSVSTLTSLQPLLPFNPPPTPTNPQHHYHPHLASGVPPPQPPPSLRLSPSSHHGCCEAV